jgi:hypothetical protein
MGFNFEKVEDLQIYLESALLHYLMVFIFTGFLSRQRPGEVVSNTTTADNCLQLQQSTLVVFPGGGQMQLSALLI